MQRSIFLATFTATMLLAGAAHAQTPDHLQCFKIKDSAAKASYTADITPSDPAFAGLEPGCTVQLPARLLCVDAVKSNVDPAPPGAPEGVPLQKFLCYKTKCAKFSASGDLSDQFGDHSVTTKSGGLLCAPVVPPCTDADADTYCAEVDDCDDSDAAVRPGATETCNGLDDDCDGASDEANPGSGQACATGLSGVCSTGTTTCSGGSIACIPDVSASAEVCDGLDNDCDGTADNGNPGAGQACSTGLPGVCSSGTTTCDSGSIACGQNVASSSEVCDGLDNNCDGTVDGNTRSCYSGPAGTSGVGVCRSGTQTCTAGSFGGPCSGQVLPTVENCSDGLDNNCDGVVNNGCP